MANNDLRMIHRMNNQGINICIPISIKKWHRHLHEAEHKTKPINRKTGTRKKRSKEELDSIKRQESGVSGSSLPKSRFNRKSGNNWSAKQKRFIRRSPSNR